MLSHRTNQPWNSSTWDDLRANNSHYCLSSFLLLSTQKHPSETSSSQASFWKKKYHFKNLKSIGFDFLWIIKGELTFKLSFLILLLKSLCLFVFFRIGWLMFLLFLWALGTPLSVICPERFMKVWLLCSQDFCGGGNLQMSLLSLQRLHPRWHILKWCKAKLHGRP